MKYFFQGLPTLFVIVFAVVLSAQNISSAPNSDVANEIQAIRQQIHELSARLDVLEAEHHRVVPRGSALVAPVLKIPSLDSFQPALFYSQYGWRTRLHIINDNAWPHLLVSNKASQLVTGGHPCLTSSQSSLRFFS